MDKSLNIGVVGCGYWGPNLIRNFNALPDSKISAICDKDAKRLAHMQKLYPEAMITEHFVDFVKDEKLDAVAIATPVHTHYRFAKASLLAGKHTYIEKPMAASVAECEELVELAKKLNLTLFIGHTFIYSAPVRMIKEMISSGYLGDVYYINSQRLNLGLFQQDVNVAWDLAPHDISIIQYLFDERPTAVNCQGKANVNAKIEDITTMSLEFSNNKFAIVQSSWLDPNKVRKMTIVGSERMLVYDDNEPLEKIKIYDKRVDAPQYYDTFGEFQYSYHYGDASIPYLKQSEPLKTLCQHFVECINEQAKPESSGVEGLQVVQVLEAASKSLREDGAKVMIEQANAVDAKQKTASDSIVTIV